MDPPTIFFFLFVKDKHRFERLQELFLNDDLEKEKFMHPTKEEKWCSFHHLVLSSLRHVAEICMVALAPPSCWKLNENFIFMLCIFFFR